MQLLRRFLEKERKQIIKPVRMETQIAVTLDCFSQEGRMRKNPGGHSDIVAILE